MPNHEPCIQGGRGKKQRVASQKHTSLGKEAFLISNRIKPSADFHISKEPSILTVKCKFLKLKPILCGWDGKDFMGKCTILKIIVKWGNKKKRKSRSSLVAQQVGDPALLLLWLGSLLWQGFEPWLNNFHMPQAWPEKKKERKKI